MKKILCAVALALLLIPGVAMGAKAKKKAKNATPQLSTLEIITKVNDQWQKTHSPKVRSFWDDAAYFTGNMEAYKLTGLARYLEYSDKWARYNKWSGAREKDASKWRYKTYGEGQDFVLFGDWQICFQTYLDMYEMNPNDYKVARAKEVMSRECMMTATDFWWWADALYMVMPVMTKMYKMTGDEMYLDKLYANFLFADSLMFDQEDHLYFRDGKYIYPKHKSYSGKKDFWARGDGWVLAGLAKVLTDMPYNYKHRAFFEQRYRQLAEAVSKCQQKEGYWTRSMLDPEHADGPETSGTAFFTYGLYWGLNNGYLDRATYLPVAERGWKYLSTVALQKDFTVGYVQPIGEKAIRGQQLTGKNTANFGTGAFLLAACEKVRFDENSVRPTDNKSFTITISNPTTDLRNEVVELDAKTVFQRLGISGGRQFIVYNSLKQEQPYQLTYDGKILVEVSLRGQKSGKLTIVKGTPSVYKNVAYGRMYPERVDDIAWENDFGAYRCYGPALQKRGEKAYGYDIWVKNTPELVCEDRYHTEEVMHERQNPYRKTNKAVVDSIEHSMSYHLDHGRGLDAYSVGPTLGIGTPALMSGDKINFPYCYDKYEILDNGPLRFTVHLIYKPTVIKGDTIIEHRLISLDKGSNFNRSTVWYEGLIHPMTLASGIVIHTADTESCVLGGNFVAYADPSDRPKDHNFQTFLGVLFPEGNVSTIRQDLPQPEGDHTGHLLCRLANYNGNQKYTYYFGTAWSKYDCRSLAGWQVRMASFARDLKSPLTIAY